MRGDLSFHRLTQALLLMKQLYSFFLFLFIVSFRLTAQIVVTSPQFPTDSDLVTITFDATKGTAGLKDYVGDVYAHTGVITDKSTSSSDWKYASTWGNNAAKYKLTSIGNNKWTLQLTPSIRQYYGVPQGETIKQLAFVFRSSDNKLEGKGDDNKDIFADVYASGLILRFDQPDATLYTVGEKINIQLTASAASDISLLVDGATVTSVTNSNVLSTQYTLSHKGQYTLKGIAKSSSQTVETTLVINAIEATQQEKLPAGVRPGINYINDTQATLVLQAPYKKHVYVIGDFNDWQYNADYQMKQDGEYFWITLSNLEKGKEYAYQYVVDQSITIADPYTEKVLDMWNDPYITSSVYPNLKPFPQKANGIVSVLQTAQQPYQWRVEQFTKPAKEQLMIYEILIRDFTTEHTYNAAQKHLPYLKTLGINAIELMPVNEFEGNSSWGYNPSFYFAPDKYYGTKDDLKSFIDACHENGMAVIIDLVLNHSFGQSPFYQLYRDADGKPSKSNPWYNQQSNIANPDLCWGYDFNHESTYTRALIDSVAGFWIQNYKVDGFRYDFTKGFSNTPHTGWANDYDAPRIKNLKRMSDEVWKRDPESYIIFEHLTSGTSEEKTLAEHGIMLWKNANGTYCETAMGWEGPNTDFGYIFATNSNMPAGSLVGYMESHDEERTSYKAKSFGNASIKGSLQKRMKQAATNAAFFLTVPGPKMIWQFGELGYDISIDENGRTGEKPVLWNYYDEAERKMLYDQYARLIALRNSYPHLFDSSANFRWRVTATDWAGGRFITSTRGNDAILIGGNFTSNNANLEYTFPKVGTWYDLDDEKITVNVTKLNERISLPVGAHSYRLFTNFKPIITDIDETVVNAPSKVYYLSSSDELCVDGEAASIQIYTVSGLLSFVTEGQSRVSLSALLPGYYIARVKMADGSIISCKLVR